MPHGNDHDFLSFFDKYGSKFVTRYDRRDDKHHLAELEKELVLYGMEITPFTVEDYEIELVPHIQTMQQENISSRKINFVVEKSIAVPCVNSDEIRLQQVLMNIVGNAAKITPKDGTITLRAWQTDITEKSVTTVFEIEDTGCGMSREFQEKKFDSFSQERNKIQSSIKGTGLGMAISYLIMKTFGRDITVRSEIDAGSCFTVTFPAEVSETEEIAEHSATEGTPHTAPQKESLTILVAEDNELNAEIITEILISEGHTVEVAENGQVAVDIRQVRR